MKKLSVILCLSVIVLLLASLAMAGGINNKQNFSIEYDRTASRNAANNSADAAVYNPAGVMQLEDGFYLNAGGFYVMKDYSNTIGGAEYSSDDPSLIPSLIGLYKKGDWAAFGAITIPGGGGEVTYGNGSATTQGYGTLLIAGANYALTQPPYSLPPAAFYDTVTSQSLEAESIYYGLSLGGAYEVNDLVSVAAGMRFIKADKESKASMTIGPSTLGILYSIPEQTFDIAYEETADGMGGFLGVNIAPNDSLNIGMRYETSTKLGFETDLNTDDTGMLTDGAKEKDDLPGLLGIGVGYNINPDLRLDTSITYYFEKEATREDPRFDDVGNGYDLAMALEYAFNEMLKGSAGYMRTIVDISPDNMQPEAAELDAHTVAAGIAYTLRPGLDLNFSLMKNIYNSQTRSDGIELHKKLFCLGFGVQYKFSAP
ncbi:MAG: outer membrane protein transport protein [Deltaproteobacteria bacterium]|nr:outer membrane protein transport protein [Deltaproteobacteria bacterium]